ncbi:sulfite exporter TauE/SafE family protein [Staphylococcus cohnii]|uniref:sulfite exporter TauE/SafE family protein n=2 Tax=Staphylococcus TaxID=1279 RepID=UPI000D1B2D48|nr:MULTISPECIES: sulfite exporter TauE/SafE family protein [Staphylococcus]MBA1353146.1 TSUP family transporter [Staphylococcus cohnii]MBA1389878.1 TSUP family transporter [Staphylococcus cohnii]MCE5099048.1 sulfite exporter TauE/SafE family protein [Staphylococcus cohnii]PTE78851.1 sulfite exporter TauE/SafE family protein [Staphylococcus cohnii]PTF20701.1 sulfite exporter TauE/SafE family protein [Staphylococcus cohnii]
MDLFLVYILIAIFLGGLVRTYFGFGEALVSMPLLTLIGLNLHTSISLVGLAGLMVASLNIFLDYRNIKIKVLLLMLLGSLLGVPIGILILQHITTSYIQLMLGLFLILYGVYAFGKITFFKNRYNIILKSNIWASLTGMISGILGSLYNSHGVPVVIYGTMSPWHIKDFRSTVQAHFLITAIFVVIGQASGGIWTGQTVSLFLLSIPCLIISVIIGKYLINHTTYHNFEKWIYLFITILGFLLLLI